MPVATPPVSAARPLPRDLAALSRLPPAAAGTRPWLPLALFALAWAVCVTQGGDVWLADRLFALEGGQWSLRHAFATEVLIHRGGRLLSALDWLCVLAAFGLSWIQHPRRHLRRHLRRPLLALLVAVPTSCLLIAALKSGSGVDCPWDLVRYGGDRPGPGLFELRPAHLPHAACFPAAHAGVGYAWVALYGFFARVRPTLRWWGLAAGLAMGLLFGISQQLRGAHFLSHDLAALLVCWLVALAAERLTRDPDAHPAATPPRCAPR